jgi:hypothetical protein
MGSGVVNQGESSPGARGFFAASELRSGPPWSIKCDICSIISSIRKSKTRRFAIYPGRQGAQEMRNEAYLPVRRPFLAMGVLKRNAVYGLFTKPSVVKGGKIEEAC